MKITFLQSGGFAGALRGCRLDAAVLPVAERSRLEQLVGGCGVEHSSERFSPAGSDRRQYDLAIERDGRVIRLACDDGSLPEAARPLIDYLASLATPQGLDFALPEPRDPAVAAVTEPLGAAKAASPRSAAVMADGAGPSASRWGRFEGEIVARWEDDGRQMTLVEPFAYLDPREVRWEAPAGSLVNGASIPRAFWSFMGGPFAGEFRDASVVHDVACEERDRPWRAVHRMFYEACRCGGVGSFKAKTMYYAVFHFGPRWHVEERTTIVAGKPHVEPVIRDETPQPPTEEEAAAIVRYFETHVVAAADIPTLAIIDADD
ncbi:MAG: DUF1353 domain-containing protein [Planctomycetota bacterium]|jgi:hypothetical protein|nr:DUF1353 domain-containing protein [Planctomycetota bacterium]MDA1201380.1 DUF1353 domain-containing protein [Planctomycetota bacterium]